MANPDFTYDADGNMLCVNAVSGCTGAARSYGWTSFDRVASITQGAGGASLAYDPEHNRGALTDAGTGNTTWYFRNPAAASASELLSGATSTWRDYLVAYGEIVAERFNMGGTPLVYYFVGDHLASTTALTDANEARKEYDSYDAWGKRRYASGTDASGCNSMHPTSLTLRGFTAQEEMDSYCLVNLNARLYDPSIGRMLSADPTAPDPMSGQSFNRYSYVENKPLSAIDPSGYADETESEYFRIHCIDGGCYVDDSGTGDGSGYGMPDWGMSGPGYDNGEPIFAAETIDWSGGSVTCTTADCFAGTLYSILATTPTNMLIDFNFQQLGFDLTSSISYNGTGGSAWSSQTGTSTVTCGCTGQWAVYGSGLNAGGGFTLAQFDPNPENPDWDYKNNMENWGSSSGSSIADQEAAFHRQGIVNQEYQFMKNSPNFTSSSPVVVITGPEGTPGSGTSVGFSNGWDFYDRNDDGQMDMVDDPTNQRMNFGGGGTFDNGWVPYGSPVLPPPPR